MMINGLQRDCQMVSGSCEIFSFGSKATLCVCVLFTLVYVCILESCMRKRKSVLIYLLWHTNRIKELECTQHVLLTGSITTLLTAR
jgi:hypothetical protein